MLARVLDQQVRALLGGATGAIRPELAPFHEALTSADRPGDVTDLPSRSGGVAAAQLVAVPQSIEALFSSCGIPRDSDGGSVTLHRP